MPIKPGDTAPDFTLLGEDGEVSLADLTPALLLFFKNSCPTCDLAFPVYGELHRRYGDALPLVAIGQDQIEKSRPWLDERDFAGPVLDDLRNRLGTSADYDLETVPTLVLVGEDGTVAHVTEGWDREDANDWARRLGELTDRPAEPVSTEGDGLPPFRPG